MNAHEIPDTVVGQDRVDAIRSRLTVLDPAFLERYRAWLMRFEKQEIGNEDVADILEASDAELSRLDAEFSAGRINDPSRAVARAQVRHLADALLGQDQVSAGNKKRLREYRPKTGVTAAAPQPSFASLP
ncbi:hypothetical protein L0U85_07990 [Glycomyces sp. L485]|uniref:hypothetical protein n=1 Tax=Glycomyces sp. L485 TaxID=2909235 RepID=UPI001F4B701F|nr:hypothetical protein [Glycomyces sp. L485]MCH7230790.1 hypothetical protein [Glycomyces sp. L485]